MVHSLGGIIYHGGSLVSPYCSTDKAFNPIETNITQPHFGPIPGASEIDGVVYHDA